QPAQKLIGQPIGSIYGNIDAKEPIEDLMISFSHRDHPLPTFIENAERAIQGRLIPWRNPDSEWLGIIAIFRDVTREVKADQARNDFINALSREVRAPLTAVKGYSELITQGMIGDYSPQQIHVQQIIHSNADRVVEVLDNAVKISAESRHKLLPRYEEINICKILENVLREIAPVAAIREVSLTREFEPGLPPLTADAKHIYRIFYNLLSNACRFTPPGGQVKVKTWLQEDVWGRTSQPLIYASVTDNGVGIPKKDLTRVFDRFYRVKSPLMNGEDEGGMGLGLTVVKELVELHHGRVWVESILGEGSAFYIALPVTQEY
ncbi:MAG: ATP-binding protein, partial [Anaerolineae bacterium]|nr:ATP-binding protein [Anaerolineae bacterium]